MQVIEIDTVSKKRIGEVLAKNTFKFKHQKWGPKGGLPQFNKEIALQEVVNLIIGRPFRFKVVHYADGTSIGGKFLDTPGQTEAILFTRLS